MTLFCRVVPTLLLAMSLAGPALAQQLPPLPEAIRSQGVLRAGVRCDQPPYGFRGPDGGFAGVEVDMARQMAAWAFGSADKAELACVTAENRIPQLQARRVDLLIATLGVTPDRARVIDFSDAYRWGGSDMLVKRDSPIQKLDDVRDRTVIMLEGHYAGELVRRKHAWPKCPSPEHGVRRSSGSPPGPGRGLRPRCGNARGNRDTGPVTATGRRAFCGF